jgi:hypothetical protein
VRAIDGLSQRIVGRREPKSGRKQTREKDAKNYRTQNPIPPKFGPLCHDETRLWGYRTSSKLHANRQVTQEVPKWLVLLQIVDAL